MLTICKLLALVMLIVFLFSCKSVKEVIKTKTVYDSTAIEQNQLLQKTLHETVERYEKEREQWESTGVVFDNTPCPDSTVKVVRMPAKIIFDNGKIKSIEGNVKALNQSLYVKATELAEARDIIDSLRAVAQERELLLIKKQETAQVFKEKKAMLQWWWFVVCAAVGALLEWHFKILKRLLSLKTLIMRRFTLFLLSVLAFLPGCSKFHNDPGTSVWAEGGWLVFWVPFLGGLWFTFLGYRGSQSPAMKNGIQVADKTPIYKIPKFWFGVVLVVIAFGFVWYFNSPNWR